MNIDLNVEHTKEKIMNEYVPEQEDLYDYPIENICTVQQLEIFYRTLVLDLYRRENKINYSF